MFLPPLSHRERALSLNISPKGQEDDEALREEIRLEHEVLAFLQKGGPQNWDVLSVHFDPSQSSGLMGHVLHMLKNLEFIIEDPQSNRYKISRRGLHRLQEKRFWKSWGIPTSE